MIVIISCHGIDDNYIVSSDYKQISKTAIHRIFSGKKPLNRKNPRNFIFDCCSGDYQRDEEIRSRSRGSSLTKGVVMVDDIDNKMEESMVKERGKNTEVYDITRKDTMIWAINEENPDFRLVLINAANEGFQSKMRTDTGSYVISEFCKRVEINVDENHNKKFLYEILDDIQEDLHSKGKQLMVKQFNNETERIKFQKKKNLEKSRSQLSFALPKSMEMQRIDSDGYVLFSE